MNQKLLNPEPSIPVLRSLAVRIGLNQAIVLQQLHFRLRLSDDGWVERAYAQWAEHDFPFWSNATIRRVFDSLRELGIVHVVEGVDRVLRWRVDYDAVPEYALPVVLNVSTTSAQSEQTSSVSIEKRAKRTASPTPSSADEPIGFSEWVGYHCIAADRSVPRAGTSARAKLAATFSALMAEGYALEDFKLATDGVLGDPFMVENGHTAPENVLRKSKIVKRIDDGRKARLAAAAGDKYAGLVSN